MAGCDANSITVSRASPPARGPRLDGIRCVGAILAFDRFAEEASASADKGSAGLSALDEADGDDEYRAEPRRQRPPPGAGRLTAGRWSDRDDCIRIVPIASSGVDEPTEFVLRHLAVSTGGTYVFLTDHSGIGNAHIEPTVGPYVVAPLNDLLVEVIGEYTRSENLNLTASAQFATAAVAMHGERDDHPCGYAMGRSHDDSWQWWVGGLAFVPGLLGGLVVPQASRPLRGGCSDRRTRRRGVARPTVGLETSWRRPPEGDQTPTISET